MSHPVVIHESVRVYARTPYNQPMKRWEERYPDGSIRTFEERFHTCTVRGTTYCMTMVYPLDPDLET